MVRSMSGPRYVRRVRIHAGELVKTLDCGHEQRLDLDNVPAAWRTPTIGVDLNCVLRARAQCVNPACGGGEPPKRAA